MSKNTLGILAFAASLIATAAFADANSDGGYTYCQEAGYCAPEFPTPVQAKAPAKAASR